MKHKVNVPTFSGDPLKFNQSEGDFKTPEVFPILCALCIRRPASLHLQGGVFALNKTTVTNSALILEGSVTLIYEAIAHKQALTIIDGF